MNWALPGGLPRRVNRAIFLSFVLGALALLAVPVAFAADPGQTTFEQKCKACHTIGGGKLVGPDLKGVTSRRDKAWLAQMIMAPDKLISSGDATAKQLVQESGMAMPNLGISQQDTDQVIAYLAGGAAPSSGPDNSKPGAVPVGDAARGRSLFTGQISFVNGGTACASCHDVESLGSLGGGNLAADLTNSFTKYGGADGLRSVIVNLPFPLMQGAFVKHRLTDAEVSDLVAFLQSESARGAQPHTTTIFVFTLLGVAGIVVLLVLCQILWRGRLQGVRQSLVKGGLR